MRPLELLGDLADDGGTGGVREPVQLAQMLIEQLERPRPLRWSADEQGALDGRGDGNQFA
jgi:hypothetical protein